MIDLGEQLKKIAEINFCEKCYHYYLTSIHGQIEGLLSVPMTDWRRIESNIDLMWIKAKGFYDIVNSTIFRPNKTAFQKVKDEKLWKKLKFLKEKGILKDSTYKLLSKVSQIRNKIHPQYKPPYTLSKKDYFLFGWAKNITETMGMRFLYDFKDDSYETVLANVDNCAKQILLKYNL